MAPNNSIDSYKEIVDTAVARKRIEQLIGIASSFYLEPVEEVFVSEHREKEGRQIIQSVWMFSKSYGMEFKNPLKKGEETFDLAIVKNSVKWVETSKKEFDFSDATADSRMSVNFALASEVSGQLRATGKNCLALLRIVRERLLPNAVVRS